MKPIEALERSYQFCTEHDYGPSLRDLLDLARYIRDSDSNDRYLTARQYCVKYRLDPNVKQSSDNTCCKE